MRGVAATPDDAPHRLGLYCTTVHVLVALYRDSRDNSHRRAMENQFDIQGCSWPEHHACKLFSIRYIVMCSKLTTTLSHIATYNWSHQLLINVCPQDWWYSPAVYGPCSQGSQSSTGDFPHGHQHVSQGR